MGVLYVFIDLLFLSICTEKVHYGNFLDVFQTYLR